MLASLLGLLGVLWVGRRRSHVRDEVEQDLRILDALPKNFASRYELESSIAARIRTISNLNDVSRDPAGIMLAVVLLMGAGACLVAAIRGPGLWWAAVGVLALFGFVGLGGSAPKAHRDSRGNKVTSGGTNPNAG